MDLGRGLRAALAKLTGQALVDEAAVKSFVREIQRLLISNDVPVKLVFELSKRIESKALDANLPKGLSIKEHVVRTVYDELTALLGTAYDPSLKPRRLLLLGLYGSGKTTTCGKLSAFYKSRGLSVGLIACDVDRPAAVQQLEQLSKQTGAAFYASPGEMDVSKILRKALPLAKEDLLIVDSAGRSAFDEGLVEQLKTIVNEFNPDEKILVMSADIGQVAGRQALQFHQAVGLTGVILTKIDGSGKGGGSLAACASAGVPVLFTGTGEKMGDLEPFNSQKFVGRLLGFPDLEALMSKVQQITKEEQLQEQGMEKLTLGAFYQQLKTARKMGPLSSVMGMLGVHDLPADLQKTSEDKLKKYEAIIASCTAAEREEASLIRKQKGRLERIAKGAGVKPDEVRELLTQFEKIAGMMEGFKKNRGMRKKLEKMLGKSGVDPTKLQGMMGGG
jgi:signal recognition particle subunit SRP54